MKNEFSYMRQVSYMDSISVENVGNCVLEAYNDDGDKYLLVIRTALGISRILQIGPISTTVNTNCFESFIQIDYDENKISKIIDKFLNGNSSITQVESYSAETKEDFKEFTDSLPNIKDFLYD